MTRSFASPATTTGNASPGPMTTALASNIETHGPYTTNGDFLERLFRYIDSPYLRFNFDTGNTFISGNDPLDYLKRFRPYVAHCHIKDVAAELAESVRGDETGIATSEVPLGGGVNAENIQKCVNYLKTPGGAACSRSSAPAPTGTSARASRSSASCLPDLGKRHSWVKTPDLPGDLLSIVCPRAGPARRGECPPRLPARPQASSRPDVRHQGQRSQLL